MKAWSHFQLLPLEIQFGSQQSFWMALEQGAFPPPLLDWRRAEYSPDGLVEHRLQAALCERRALQILHSP